MHEAPFTQRSLPNEATLLVKDKFASSEFNKRKPDAEMCYLMCLSKNSY